MKIEKFKVLLYLKKSGMDKNGKAPIITFIFNNHRLGMVRQWQELIYDCRYSQTITERGPDFVKLANANGLKGARVNTLDLFKIPFVKLLFQVFSFTNMVTEYQYCPICNHYKQRHHKNATV